MVHPTMRFFIWMISLFPLVAGLHQSSDTYHVVINVTHPVNIVDEQFLSITIEYGLIQKGFSLYDFKNPRLLTLIRALSPLYLRLGGTGEDFMIFEPNGVYRDPVHNFKELQQLMNVDKVYKKFNMTGDQLDTLLNFAFETNAKLFIGLNVFPRKGGEWDSDNTKVLLDYVHRKGSEVCWELGNEPPWKKFNVTITAEQLAKDFISLYNLLKTYPRFRSSLLVGPDIGQFRGKKYKMEFYDEYIKRASQVLNAVTWHQYYTNGRTAKLSDFVDPDLLDDFKEEIHVFMNITRRTNPSIPVWMGETSSTYGGGTEGLSNSYVAGFMWLDKLGLSAREGLKIVMRQTLLGGHYALVDDDNQPYPDYWLSLIFRNLVGRRVLNATMGFEDNHVRVYAHCTSERSLYNHGTVVLYALNLHKKEIEITDGTVLPSIGGIRIHNSIDQFVLTPCEDDLQSKCVRLNGDQLKMPDETTIPVLKPLNADRIVLPKLSFGFFVLKRMIAPACL